MNNQAQPRWRQYSQPATLLAFTIILTVLLTLVFSANLVVGSQVDVIVGEPAGQNIYAESSIRYDSEVLTEQAREQARQSVPDIYTGININVLRNQDSVANEVFSFIDTVRADALADQATKITYLTAIESLQISAAMAEQILNLSQSGWTTVKNDVLRILEDVMRDEIRDTNLEAQRQSVNTRISITLDEVQEELVTNLAAQLIVPNSFLDEEATEAERTAQAEAVEPEEVRIATGQLILGIGDVVQPEHVEALEKLGVLRPEARWPVVFSIALASLLSMSMIAIYWQRYDTGGREYARYLFITGVLLLVFAVGIKAILITEERLVFLFPAAALTMLLATLLDVRLAIFITVVMAGLVGYTEASLELATFIVTGSALSVLTLRNPERFIAFFRAGLVLAVANSLVVLLFFALDNPGPTTLLELVVYAIINGLLITPGVTLGAYFILGGLFSVLTILQLQELSRLDHPLLKELLRRAPGTYHHSIMVANLAEQAAERVEANSTLVRVGAFYHDIGKMNRPPFFTENQAGVSPHESLDPYISARIIIGHVTDGLELAKKYRLPNRIQDFIAQHHGNRAVYSFYMKAVEQAGGDESDVDRERFRYPGPRPRSRETGIVLLADSVDAASTALRPNTEEAIVRLVNKIVDDHLNDAQLDNSGLTLGDIYEIRQSFVETLKGRFHVRIRYPGNEELEAPPVQGALPAGTPAGSTPAVPSVPVANPLLTGSSQEGG
jgi:putative nucleotidyltransferase with HDIG domain